jgi:hypothetical protein
LIGNDGNCIEGHFYDATVSKMAANKIDKLLILLATIFKIAAIRSRFFFGQNILPTLLNIYAKFYGNPFGAFRYK